MKTATTSPFLTKKWPHGWMAKRKTLPNFSPSQKAKRGYMLSIIYCTYAQGVKYSSVLPWQAFYFKEDNLGWIVWKTLLWELLIKLLRYLPKIILQMCSLFNCLFHTRYISQDFAVYMLWHGYTTSLILKLWKQVKYPEMTNIFSERCKLDTKCNGHGNYQAHPVVRWVASQF